MLITKNALLIVSSLGTDIMRKLSPKIINKLKSDFFIFSAIGLDC